MQILDVALSFPDRRERLVDLGDDLGLARDQMRMFDRFFGFRDFRCDPDQPLAAGLAEAAADVLARNPHAADRLRKVVHCHTLMSVSPFGHEGSALLAPFAGGDIEVFGATMNHCATGVSMLGLMSRLLDGGEVGLVLVGEKAFHPAIRVIENTTIMGEAAAAVLVGEGEGLFDLLGCETFHDTRFWLNSGQRGENYLAGFDAAYLGFASKALTSSIERFGVSFDRIRYVLPHNVNAPSWYAIAQNCGVDRNKLVLSTIAEFGHCFGADPFINLIHVMRQGQLAASDLVLLFSIGLGATASCALLRVREPVSVATFETEPSLEYLT
ncbi:MAG: 3-oxoacyl-[acyl-carrier-protein] synthase III C-terminal domain-containing protein [Paracoccaceae bacterium]